MPPPRKAFSPPCILAPASPAVKQVETSLQGRLPQSRVELQGLERLVADAEKNRVPRLPVDVDLGVEQGVPDAVLVGDAIAIDAVAPVARLRAGEVAPDLAHRFAGEADAAQLRYRRAHALDELDGAQAQRFAARLHHRKEQRALAPGGPGEENILAEIPQILQALVDGADIAPHVLEREAGGRGVIRKHIEPGLAALRCPAHARTLPGAATPGAACRSPGQRRSASVRRRPTERRSCRSTGGTRKRSRLA